MRQEPSQSHRSCSKKGLSTCFVAAPKRACLRAFVFPLDQRAYARKRLNMRLLLLLVWLLASVGIASADESTVDPAADRKLAAEHYNAGRDAFTAGRYATALLEFEAAYALSHEPILVEDMAVTAEKMGNVDKAIELSRKFLTLVNKADEPEAVEAASTRIARLAGAAPIGAAALQPAAAPSRPQGADKRASHRRATIGGSVLVAGGGSFLVASLITAALGGSLANMVENTPLTLPALDDSLSRGRGLNAASGATAGIGVALVVGGGLWLGLDRRKRD